MEITALDQKFENTPGENISTAKDRVAALNSIVTLQSKPDIAEPPVTSDDGSPQESSSYSSVSKDSICAKSRKA